MIIGGWLKNGLPTGELKKPKPVEFSADLPAIIKAIKKADLDPTEAISIVSTLRERDLIDFGITKAGPGKQKFITFLRVFWDIKESPYLRDKLAHGHKITKRYCMSACQMIEKHWQPYFGDSKKINEIERSELRDFSLFLHKNGLASSTLNNIMIIGTSALKWAHTEGMITSDPTLGLSIFTGDKVSRDILSEAETEAVFESKWADKRAYIAALLSLTTGLRSGEIRALRRSDICETTLTASHSWNDTEGLKCPKNGDARIVPLLPEIHSFHFQLLKETPHQKIADPFIFYSADYDKPCSSELFRRNFKRACENISKLPPGWVVYPEKAKGKGPLWASICERNSPWSEPEPFKDEKLYESSYRAIYCRNQTRPPMPLFIDLEKRKLDFHSFRHAFATRMAERMEADKVAKVAWHRSKAAAQIYQGHITDRILNEMGNEIAQEFKNILQFHAEKGA
jgi:integrase